MKSNTDIDPITVTITNNSKYDLRIDYIQTVPNIGIRGPFNITIAKNSSKTISTFLNCPIFVASSAIETPLTNLYSSSDYNVMEFALQAFDSEQKSFHTTYCLMPLRSCSITIS